MFKGVSVRGTLFVAAAALLLVGGATADDAWIGFAPDGGTVVKAPALAQAPALAVRDLGDTGLRVRVDLAGLAIQPRKTVRGEFAQVTWPGASFAGDIGAPAIPVVRRLFLGPLDAAVTFSTRVGPATVLGQPILLIPNQAPIPKIPGAYRNAEFNYDATAYAVNAAEPALRATVEEVGIVRGQRLFLLEVRPVAYNPAGQTLTVWKDVTVNVQFTAGARTSGDLLPLPGVDRLVLNPEPSALADRGTGNYLIIVATTYETAIAGFATAKAAQGFTVTTHGVAPGTSTATIKTYIQNLYNGGEPTAPDYVLLVGDTDSIPYWTGGGEGTPPTDLPYVCMDGVNDWDPDIAIGRFPVRSPTHVADVVEKTLNFENGIFADPGYTQRAVFMASEDNYTVSEGTHNWVITNYMVPNNIASDKLYCHTYNATTQQVRDAFNNGRLYGIYSGHGGTTYWADGPVFYPSDVQALTNYNMYPFVCSFACVTGDYTSAECFMETWLLVPDKGAVTAWGSSVTSYWTEDDVLEKRLFDVLFQDYVRELGPCYNLTKYYYKQEMGSGQTTRRYFEMYNLMGDPSVYLPDAEAALIVNPSTDLISEGPEGGPFNPLSKEYEVRNVADYAISYQVTHEPGATWVTLSGATSGLLTPQQTAYISVTINSNAESLPIGRHTDVVAFANLTDGVGDTGRDVTLEVGRYVFHSTDVPKTINDNSTVTSTLTIGDHFCIGDVDVAVDITHTYIGDLVVTLESPEGTVVTLHNRSGSSTDNIQTTYDDEGDAPDGPGALSDFDLESPLGTWTLTVSDQVGGDTGTLNAWSLRLLPAGESCPPVASDVAVGTPTNLPVDIALQGQSSSGNPLNYIVTSLPGHGALRDPNAAPIATVPYTLVNQGNIVRYTPAVGYEGLDSFTYIVNDGQSSNTATVTIDVGGPQPIHVVTLDTNPGWACEGSWAWGQPTGGGSYNHDPTAGHTGSRVYGYNLNGDYTNNMPARRLTTNAFDCTGYTEVELRFWRWLGVEESAYDQARVEVSNNGTSWTPVWVHSGAAMADTSWKPVVYDVSAVADDRATVYIRWTIGPTDYSGTYPGWNIDDVELWGNAPPPEEYDPGDMNCDGLVNSGDIPAFVMALTDRPAYEALYPDCPADELGDLDGSGEFNSGDIPAFVELLTGG